MSSLLFGSVGDDAGPFGGGDGEAHNVANLGMDHRAHKRSIAAMTRRILDLGKSPLIAIATAFGCPLGGPVSEDEVLRLVEWAVELGITQVMLGDTTGMADPAHAYQLTGAVAQRFPETRLVGHFHDTRGSGIANTLAAIAAGATTVDSSLGGVGGEPPAVNQNHSGPSGNVCTEDLVALLDRMSVRTGIDVQAVLRLGQYVEEVSGSALRSQVLQSGVAVPRATTERGQHADARAETEGVGRS